ncbi:hypothetical protein [Thalassobacillus pellis]|uniref:hypothetical protein n=1 Tax=Thalassobacillus pellis TaxID=748008 RepID=UPI001960B7F5|nr:hypothetical protein [Thalassobacillus pellis]MBM7554774.1 hypothetical protein [Thalassobacillus pellis]
MKLNTLTVRYVKTLFICMPLLLFAQPVQDVSAAENKAHNHSKSEIAHVSTKEKPKSEIKDLDKATIQKRTDEFMEQLVQKTDENFRVLKYDSKEALVESFTPFATKQVAKKYIDFYYKEKESGLYILPTETPPWFVNDVPYDTISIDDKHKRIVQTNDSELYGKYTVTIDLEYDGKWRITEVKHS